MNIFTSFVNASALNSLTDSMLSVILPYFQGKTPYSFKKKKNERIEAKWPSSSSSMNEHNFYCESFFLLEFYIFLNSNNILTKQSTEIQYEDKYKIIHDPFTLSSRFKYSNNAKDSRCDFFI